MIDWETDVCKFDENEISTNDLGTQSAEICDGNVYFWSRYIWQWMQDRMGFLQNPAFFKN